MKPILGATQESLGVVSSQGGGWQGGTNVLGWVRVRRGPGGGEGSGTPPTMALSLLPAGFSAKAVQDPGHGAQLSLEGQ